MKGEIKKPNAIVFYHMFNHTFINNTSALMLLNDSVEKKWPFTKIHV